MQSGMFLRICEEDGEQDARGRQEKTGAWNGSIHQKNIKETSKDSESMIQNPGTGSAQYTTINIEESRNQIGTTFHSEYRSIQTKVNNAAHTTTHNSFRAQRGGSAREGVRANAI